MRRFATILLSGAALAAISSAAMAADPVIMEPYPETYAPAPVAAAPAPSMETCSVMGAGYFNIPGAATCLKIGGAVEARVGHLRVNAPAPFAENETWANVRARMDFETATDTDYGVVGSHVRLSMRHDVGAYPAGYLPSAHPFGYAPVGSGVGDDRTIGVELAYITFGPAYAGFKGSLYNRAFGFGEMLDPESLGGMNSLTAGFLHTFEGGYYVGLAAEDNRRGQWIASYNDADAIDFVARGGLKDQSWGGADLSFIYSRLNDAWAVKGTTDLKVLDATDLRLAAEYVKVAGADEITLGGGVQHGITEQVKGFAGVQYGVNSNVWAANAGVVWTAAEGFDVTGEVGYTDLGQSVNAWNTGLRFVRSW